MDCGSVAQAVGRLVWPKCCAHCREDLCADEDSPLCLACRLKLAPNEPPFCERCGEPAAAWGHCSRCRRRLFRCELIRSAFLYRDAAVSLVHAFKYSGRRSAARAAGRWMAAAWPRLPELQTPDLVVPMPLHSRRRRQRGYNQALLIAEGLAKTLGLPLGEPLVRLIDTRAQWSLGRDERERNVEGAFAVKSPDAVSGRKVLIVDDVCTSGASLEACAKALKEAGATRVDAYVFARQCETLKEA